MWSHRMKFGSQERLNSKLGSKLTGPDRSRWVQIGRIGLRVLCKDGNLGIVSGAIEPPGLAVAKVIFRPLSQR